jgi:hypothetical protein
MHTTFATEATSVRELEHLFEFVDTRRTDAQYVSLIPSLLTANLRAVYPWLHNVNIPANILDDPAAALEVAEHMGVVSIYRFQQKDYDEDPDLVHMGAVYCAHIGGFEEHEDGNRQWMPSDSRARAIVLAIIQLLRALARAACGIPAANPAQLH